MKEITYYECSCGKRSTDKTLILNCEEYHKKVLTKVYTCPKDYFLFEVALEQLSCWGGWVSQCDLLVFGYRVYPLYHDSTEVTGVVMLNDKNYINVEELKEIKKGDRLIRSGVCKDIVLLLGYKKEEGEV